MTISEACRWSTIIWSMIYHDPDDIQYKESITMVDLRSKYSVKMQY